MDNIVFEKRELTGKKAKQLLREGILPAVVYNEKGESFNVQIPYSVGDKLVRIATSATILDAKLDGKDIKVITKEFDFDPRTDNPRHVSFYWINEESEMVFSIPFNFLGIAPAVKNNLGVLVKILSALEVKCKLASLVPAIDIDISGLTHPGLSISVSDIALPDGMVLANEETAHSAIVTITQPQKLEEVVVAEVEEGEEGEEGEAVEGEEGEAADGEAKEEDAKADKK